MKKYLYYIALLSTTIFFGQVKPQNPKVSGNIVANFTLLPLANVNIININKVKGTVSDKSGFFEIEATVNDTLHITSIGYQTLRVRVTNDWPKNKATKIELTQKAITLEEVIVRKYNLTGYLEIDSKLIPINENHRYSISGLQQGYEGGNYAPNAFNNVLSSIFNPADMLFNFFGNKPKELKKLKEMRKDDTVRNLLETKFDRETLSVLLGIDKKDIPSILERCNYSETFIKTANDLQIMDAISECYEEYKILKKK